MWYTGKAIEYVHVFGQLHPPRTKNEDSVWDSAWSCRVYVNWAIVRPGRRSPRYVPEDNVRYSGEVTKYARAFGQLCSPRRRLHPSMGMVVWASSDLID